jgi:hypothetical protein
LRIDHHQGRVHGRERANRLSGEVGKARRIDQMDQHPLPGKTRQRCIQRVAKLLLLRIEIANRAALFDGAPAADGAGCGEQAFGKRRLAGGTVADESDSAKVTGGGLAHSSSPIQVERKPQLQK